MGYPLKKILASLPPGPRPPFSSTWRSPCRLRLKSDSTALVSGHWSLGRGVRLRTYAGILCKTGNYLRQLVAAGVTRRRGNKIDRDVNANENARSLTGDLFNNFNKSPCRRSCRDAMVLFNDSTTMAKDGRAVIGKFDINY